MKNAALERTIVFVGKEKKIKKAGKISCKQLQTISKHDFFRHLTVTVLQYILTVSYTDLGSPKYIFLLPFDTPSFTLGLKKKLHYNNTILWWQLAIYSRFNRHSLLGLPHNNYQMNVESAT